MRYQVFLLAVAMIVVAVSSCGVTTSRPWVFSAADSTIRSSYAYGIAPTADGGCVFSGRVFYPDEEKSDLLLVRLDSSGDVLWRRVFGRPGHTEEGYDAVELPDGRIAVAGVRAEGTSLESDDSWLLMLDGEGTTEWERTYPLPAYDLFVCVEPGPAGGVIVAGELDESTSYSSNDMRVLSLDRDGNVLWERTLATHDWDDPGSLTPLDDGGCVLLGTCGPMDQVESDMWLVGLDGSGRIFLDIRFDSYRPDEGIAVCPDGEGGYFLAGTSGIIQADDLDISIIRVDSDGVETWRRRYGRDRDDSVISATAAPGGCLAMVGLVEGLAGAMLLDPEGSTIWRTTLPLDSVEGICTLSGGGFAVSGDVGGLATVLTLDAEGRGEWNTERSGTGESFVPDI